jgi:uncharacterized coiled-coil protein SlyX
MSSPPPESKLSSSGAKSPETDHFKDSGMALKALLALKAPVTDDARDAFLAKAKTSPFARPIAFTLLAEGWKAKPPAAWSLVRPGLKEILSDGRPFPSSDVVTRTENRINWLSAEFGITGRAQDSEHYNAGFCYLWPLFVILSFPDNESWLGQALGEFISELDASVSVAKGKSGAPAKIPAGVSLSRSIALDVVRLVQGTSPAIKLKSHLQLASKASGLSQAIVSAHEFSSRQTQILDRLLTEARAMHAEAEQRVVAGEKALAEAKATIEELNRKLAAGEQHKTLQKGIAEMRLKEALVEQRSELRFKLRQGLGNIKLYTDRPEPAKDRVVKLCDELISILDGSPS